MTDFPIPANDRRSGPFVASAGQTVFPYDFPLFDAADIAVYAQASGASAATKLAGADFTVTDIGEAAGGTIVLATGAAAGTIYSIVGARAARRTSDFTDAGELRAATLNMELDLLTQTVQEQSATIGRSLRLAETDTASDTVLPVASARAGKVVGFDASGNLVVTTVGTLALGTGDVTTDKLADGAVDLSKLGADVTAALNGATGIITAGENLADRDLIYQDVFNQRGGGAGRWYKVDTDAVGPVRISPRIGIALASITSGNTGSAQVRPGRVSGFTSLTAGQAVFASTTAGGVTQTAPAVPSTGTQNASRLIGYAASATEIDFDPDDDTVFTARNSALASGGALVVEHFTDSGGRERVASAYLVGGTAQTQVAQASGSTIGNMTANGGLAASFDGVTSQAAGVCSANASGSTGTIGKDWGSGVTRTISGVRVFGPNDTNINTANSGSTITVNLRGSTDNFSASDVSLGSFNFTDANAVIGTQLSGFTTSTAYRYHRLTISSSLSAGANNIRTAEIQFFEEAAIYDEPVPPVPERLNSSATNEVTAQFSDASNANADRFTTFRNRTNAARDLAVEVVL